MSNNKGIFMLLLVFTALNIYISFDCRRLVFFGSENRKKTSSTVSSQKIIQFSVSLHFWKGDNVVFNFMHKWFL